MRQSIFGILLVIGASVVRGVNNFTQTPNEFTKGDEEEIRWTSFQTTDLKSLKIKSSTSLSTSINLPLSNCVEKKTSPLCDRWVNNGKYTLSGSFESDLKQGGQYYLLLEWIGKGASTETGTSKSSQFTVKEDSTSSKSGSEKGGKSVTKVKGKKGKIPVGGVAGAVVGGVIIILVLLYACIKSRRKKGKQNRGTTSRELEGLGKAEDPLMGHKNRPGDWSAEIPKNLQTHESDLPAYEPYLSNSPGNKGAASEYYAMTAKDQRSSVLYDGNFAARATPKIVVNTGEAGRNDMSADQYMQMQEERRMSAAIRENERRNSQAGSVGKWTNV